jgi:hypothetical protein
MQLFSRPVAQYKDKDCELRINMKWSRLSEQIFRIDK